MEEKLIFPIKSTTTLAGVRRRITGGHHRRASPPSPSPLPRRRPRRRPSPSFFISSPSTHGGTQLDLLQRRPTPTSGPLLMLYTSSVSFPHQSRSPILLSIKPHKYPSSL
jgi:hypothetical protein